MVSFKQELKNLSKLFNQRIKNREQRNKFQKELKDVANVFQASVTRKKVKKLLSRIPSKTLEFKIKKLLTKDGPKKLRIDLSPDLTIENILKVIQKINFNKYEQGLHPIINVDGIMYTLTISNIKRLLKGIKHGKSEIVTNVLIFEEISKSDGEMISILTGEKPIDSITLDIVNLSKEAKQKFKRKVEGGFFKYDTILPIDFSRFQVYSTDRRVKYEIEKNSNNCFIQSMILSGQFTDSEIIEMKLMVSNNVLPKTKIEELCKFIGFSVTLKTKVKNPDVKKRTILKKIGKKHSRDIKIGLIDEHYFFIEKTRVTKYWVDNYESLKRIPMAQRIRGIRNGKHVFTNIDFIDSYKLLFLLTEPYNSHLLVPVKYNPGLLNSCMFKKYECDYSNLEYSKNSVKENVYEPKDGKNIKEPIIFFDFETTTDGDKHIPYLVCAEDEDGNTCSFRGENCMLWFLKWVPKNSICYAHNLGYDIRFILPKMAKITKMIEKSNSKIINLTGVFGSQAKKISFRCSYMMITSPLRDFNKMFNLSSKKEILPYELYTRDTVKLDKIKISDAKPFLSADDYIEFKKNIKQWRLSSDDEYFDHIGYSIEYCYQDVSVTKKGMNTFARWIKIQLGMNVYDSLTLASLAHKYLQIKGCYDDTYMLSGIPRSFIQKCVVGGRTMVSNNIMHHSTEVLNDFDAVSLYPSAMIRIGEDLGGFLQGEPKVLKTDQLNYKFLQSVDGYYVKINVTDVKIRRCFPLINMVNDDGIRQFNNDLRGEIFIDKIALEDLIKFQDIEFNVICGYYFDEGRNNKISEVMSFLFNKRLELKKDSNPAQIIYKLLMNSSYGKSCLKPIENEIKIVHGDDLKKFISNNHTYVLYYCPIPNSKFNKVKMSKPIMFHYNSCHIGAEILSMSKRIMNEVMCVADDNNLNINYQDTDSMHIKDSDIKTLADKYRELYNKELIGKSTGQFHSDFDFDCDKHIEPVAVESYFLGKKCYVDKIKVVNDGIVSFDHHMRMKGIPNKCLSYKIKTDYNNDPMALYKDLYDGNEIEFNLLANGAISFEAMNNYDIRNRTEFIRKVSVK